MDSLGKALENDSLARADSSIEIKPIGQPRVLPDSIAKSLNKSTKLPAPLKKDSTKSAAQQNTIEKKSEELLGNKNAKNKSETKSGDRDDKLETIAKLISGDNIFYSIVFLVFGYFIIRLLSYLLNALAERSPNYRITFKGAIPIIKIVTWSTIITLIIVVVFRPSITTMLAFSASIGVAVGFASQDILKNIFGGIVILLDRPFVSGDKIEVDKYYGEVVEIGLRSTRIVTPDDSLVSVPNSVMMSGSVSNSNSGELNCQVVAEIFLPNDTDTTKVRAIATEAAATSKYVYLNKPIVVLFFHEMNQSGSYLKMKLKAYVMDTRDEFKFKSEMTELVINELVKEGLLK
jgi:small-conductance mechanosensitive channel